jgi:hypothetical protein
VEMDGRSSSFGSCFCSAAVRLDMGCGWMLKSYEGMLVVELVLEILRSGREIWRRLAPSCMCRRELTILPFESLQSLFRVARTPSPSPPASSSFSLCRAMCLSVKLLNHRPKALGVLSCVTRLGSMYQADLFSRNEHYIASMFHSRPCDSKHDGSNVPIWKRISHSLRSYSQISS